MGSFKDYMEAGPLFPPGDPRNQSAAQRAPQPASGRDRSQPQSWKDWGKGQGQQAWDKWGKPIAQDPVGTIDKAGRGIAGAIGTGAKWMDTLLSPGQRGGGYGGYGGYGGPGDPYSQAFNQSYRGGPGGYGSGFGGQGQAYQPGIDPQVDQALAAIQQDPTQQQQILAGLSPGAREVVQQQMAQGGGQQQQQQQQQKVQPAQPQPQANVPQGTDLYTQTIA